jgi:hypothetical protein
MALATNDATRAGEIGKKRGDLLREIEASKLAAQAPLYQAQANYYNTANQSHEKIAGMQYGAGGSVDRSNAGLAGLRDAQANNYKQIADSIAMERPFNLSKMQREDNFGKSQYPNLLKMGDLNVAKAQREFDVQNKVTDPILNPPVAKPKRLYAQWYTDAMTSGMKPGDFKPEYEMPKTFLGGKVNFKPFRYMIGAAEQPRRVWDAMFAND